MVHGNKIANGFINNINPEDAEVFAQRGGLYSQLGKSKNALDDFNRAIALDNKCKYAYECRGNMYAGANEYEKALADLEYVAELYPSDEAVLYGLKNIKKLKADEDAKNQRIYGDAVTNVKALDNQTVSNENGYENKAYEYSSLAGTFQTLNDYKDAEEYSKQCTIKSDKFNELYQNAKKERERREVEEAAQKAAMKKKRRLIGILAGVIAAVMITAFIVYRQTGSFFNYEQNVQGTLTITGYSGKKQVAIPTDNKGVTVTEVGDKAFFGKKLTSVIIPEGITAIGESTFEGNRLISLVIPDSVTVIGNNAFFKNKLTGLTIGNGVTSIGDFAFSGNIDSKGNPTHKGNQLTSVSIPDNVITIGQRAFRYNQLTNVTLGNSVEVIGNRAFSANQLKSITIPNSVTSIEEAAFISNRLTNIVFPNSLISIKTAVFHNNQLNSVTIGDGVISIGEGAFARNRLSNVIIPNSVREPLISVKLISGSLDW